MKNDGILDYYIDGVIIYVHQIMDMESTIVLRNHIMIHHYD